MAGCITLRSSRAAASMARIWPCWRWMMSGSLSVATIRPSLESNASVPAAGMLNRSSAATRSPRAASVMVGRWVSEIKVCANPGINARV